MRSISRVIKSINIVHCHAETTPTVNLEGTKNRRNEAAVRIRRRRPPGRPQGTRESQIQTASRFKCGLYLRFSCSLTREARGGGCLRRGRGCSLRVLRLFDSATYSRRLATDLPSFLRFFVSSGLTVGALSEWRRPTAVANDRCVSFTSVLQGPASLLRLKRLNRVCL